MATRTDTERLIAMAMYTHQRKEMRTLITQALGKHGKPTVPLAKLREELARQLQGVSLSEFIIRERERDEPLLFDDCEQ